MGTDSGEQLRQSVLNMIFQLPKGPIKGIEDSVQFSRISESVKYRLGIQDTAIVRNILEKLSEDGYFSLIKENELIIGVCDIKARNKIND